MIDEALWNNCVSFHGHSCPGLAIGYRVALAAKNLLGVRFSADEELVCVTENDACGVDAVQVITGCSTGKGNLIHRGTGKQAFSFFDRKNNRQLRIVFRKPISKEARNDRETLIKTILTVPDEELFSVGEPSYSAPATARIFTSVVCANCGELAPEHKIRLHEGKQLCLDCFPDYTRGW